MLIKLTGWFPSQMASNGEFEIFVDVSLKKLLNTHSSCRWFVRPWWPCEKCFNGMCHPADIGGSTTLVKPSLCNSFIITSSNGNLFRVTGLLCGEFTCHSPFTGEFPSQRPVTRSFDVFLSVPWINGWVNNREAADLRRHCAHYDFTVMLNIALP